jgi:hypothetical protein
MILFLENYQSQSSKHTARERKKEREREREREANCRVRPIYLGAIGSAAAIIGV